MVISETNRYLFIEVPQTASTALAAELVEKYGGRRILRKHTDYGEFLRSATCDERSYSVVATVRNPLDIVVSKFIKTRNDHQKLYSATTESGAPWGYRFRPEARQHAFIEKHGPNFERFVRKFYRRTYNSRACLLPPQVHVLRYERLNEDFAAWLRSIGLSLVRPIPFKNLTGGRERDYLQLYKGNMRTYAARVFGPYMRRWGYSLPSEWSASEPSVLNEFMFRADSALRRLYFRHIHYGWVMPQARREVHRVQNE